MATDRLFSGWRERYLSKFENWVPLSTGPSTEQIFNVGYRCEQGTEQIKTVFAADYFSITVIFYT